MDLKVVSICAWGYYHACMKVEVDGYTFNIYISRSMYRLLRDKGVPTSQSLRFKK